MTEAKFIGIKRLQPIYFYKAKNIGEASFDSTFKTELDDKLPKITEDEFKKYIEIESDLPDYRIRDFFETLKALQEKEQQKVEPLENNLTK